jgi:HAD superfamily hydrolase (TIGR01509 family)
LPNWFDAIVSADDVTRHKPDPDVFLEAARRLGVEPRFCLVFEDTDPGIEAARRACMESVDVRNFHTPRRVT